MRILVDTHILIWYVGGETKLAPHLREILQDPHNLKMVSMVSLWEIAIKTNIGKLSISYPLDKLVPLDF
jgi:PIN domain nuclease of toxin-antitoxin system